MCERAFGACGGGGIVAGAVDALAAGHLHLLLGELELAALKLVDAGVDRIDGAQPDGTRPRG